MNGDLLDIRQRRFHHLSFRTGASNSIPGFFGYNFGSILSTSKIGKTFSIRAQRLGTSNQSQNKILLEFGLLMHKWVCLETDDRNYRHEQWMKDWNDSAWATRWEKTSAFYWSSAITSQERRKRLVFTSTGAAVGCLAVGGGLYGLAYCAAAASVTSGASASTSFSSNPANLAAIVGAVVGTAGGIMTGEMCWSSDTAKTREYLDWKENMARLELTDILKQDSRVQAIAKAHSCCISRQSIDVNLDIGATFDDWIECRTGHIYHLKSLGLNESDITVRHSESQSMVLDSKSNENREAGVDVTLQLADRTINLSKVHDENCETMLRTLTLVPAYRAIYAGLRRQLFVLKQGFPADKISDESLQLAQKQLENSLVAKALEVKLKAVEQLRAMVNMVANAFDLSFRQAERIRTALLDQLNAADAGDRLVIFIPLLDLPAYFSELR